jgi:hypothetical protein
MLHKEFWGLLFLAFVGWVLVAGNPTTRIENVCRPIGWTGNVTTSLAALVLPDQQVKVQSWFNKLEYGCRYTVWRLFYQDAYNEWVQTQKTGMGIIDSALKTEPEVQKSEEPVASEGQGPASEAERQ